MISRNRLALRRREVAALAGLAALAAWTAASAAWSDTQSTTFQSAERTLLYVSAAAAVVLCAERHLVRHVLAGVLAGVTAVSGYGLGRYLFLPRQYDFFQQFLLFRPLGYANAFGIYAVLGILLSVGFAVDASSRIRRLIALAPLVVLVPTLYYTQSRGAFVALPIGAVAGLRSARLIRSRAVLVAILAAGIVSGLAIASAKGQGFTLLGKDRPYYWRAAWHDALAHPLLGSGGGTFFEYWLRHRPIPEIVHYAHSLYLETLAELGPVGLILLAVGLGIPLAGLLGRQDPVIAFAGGAYVAFLVHAGVDWDWEVPAVPVVAVLCGAAVLVGTRPPPGGRGLGIAARAILVLGLLGLLAVVAVRLSQAGQLTFAP